MSDVNSLLSAAELSTLQAGYSRAQCVDDVRRSFEGNYPPATPAVEAVLGPFYEPLPGSSQFQIDPATRERILVALLSNGFGGGFDVAVHMYWAMMEGVSISGVLDTLLLTASYAGISRYTDNSKILLQVVIPVLKDCVRRQEADGSSVVSAISAAFPIGIQPQPAMDRNRTL